MIPKPSRRTMIVLTILLGAMSVASLVLLMVHNRSAVSATMGLVSAERRAAGAELILDTDPALQRSRWSGISIWLSETGQDTTATLHARHKDLGLGGLASHFVIGNGDGMPNGQIAVTQRWTKQWQGYRIQWGNTPLMEQAVVQICVIAEADQLPSDAQMQELVWLVRQLQRHLDVGPDQVMVHNPQGLADSDWAFSKSWLSRRLYQASGSNLR